VVIFTLVQGPTLPWLARKLGVASAVQTVDLAVDATPLEAMGADLLQVTVGPDSRLHGVEVYELRLPQGANVTLIVRGDEGFVPSPSTPIRRGDQLLIVTTDAVRRATEARVRAVSSGGRLAGWQQPRGRSLRARRPSRAENED
jgi:cell volume regulation protein A